MANKDGRRRFGNLRRRDSGRWQARYPGPDGRLRSAPDTFARKSDAERFLALVESQLARGEWTDPIRAKVRLLEYAERWISQRAGLRPRTVELYRWLLRKHIVPKLGGVPLGKLDTALIREWRSELLENGVSATMTAKAYRLLRAILMTAVKEDGILPRNPCRVPGADKESPEERPTLTLSQVFALADAVPRRYRALILLTTFASLRYGEVTALQRGDLDTDAGTVRVRQAFTEVRGQGMILGPPKSRAGVRTVAIPVPILPTLRHHLATYVDEGPAAFAFTGPNGAVIRRGNFNKLTKWLATVEKLGVPGLHFHDLRHTGNTLAAATRVSTRDLMARMGHDSMSAAIIYQHATSAADRAVAEALGVQVEEAERGAGETEESTDGPDDDGAAGALASVG